MEKLITPDINKLKLDKAVNEYAMAKKLCDLFDTDVVLSTAANDIAGCALNLLNSLNEQVSIHIKNKEKDNNLKSAVEIRDAVATAYSADSPLKMWTPEVSVQLESKDKAFVFASATQHIATLCADKKKRDSKTIGEIIRLFGGVAEQIHFHFLKAVANQINATDIQLTVPTGSNQHVSVRWDFLCSTRPAYRTTAYGELAFSREARARTPWNFNPSKRVDKEITDVLGFPDDQNIKAGNSFFHPLLPGDVVRCIDHVLGLPEGASISGTTSDTIWTTEIISNFLHGTGKSFDPNILLLPLAAIVSGYHHTALEVGLAMSINGYIAYQPGWYSSFQNGEMIKTASGKLIQDILVKAETSDKNRLMLIATDTEPMTVHVAKNDSDKEKFRKAVTMDFDGYKKWYNLARSPVRNTFSISAINEATAGLLT